MRAAAQRQLEGKTPASVHASSLRLGDSYDDGAAADTDEEGETIEVEVLAARQDRQSGEGGNTQ